jgi:hypothetical protein
VNELFAGATLLHGSAARRSQPPAPTVHVRRTYSGRPSSSMRYPAFQQLIDAAEVTRVPLPRSPYGLAVICTKGSAPRA